MHTIPQSHQLSTLLSLSRLHIIHIAACTQLQEDTSLKLSNAERMISWPPRTRHTAARSSRTSAFVLHRKTKTAVNIRLHGEKKEKKKVKAGLKQWTGLHYKSYIWLNLIHLACLTSVLQGENLCFVSIVWEFSKSPAELLFVGSALSFGSYLTSRLGHRGTARRFCWG